MRRHPTGGESRHLTINLRHLRVLAALADSHTMRSAAQVSGVSQPAVTQGIARLERQFGTELFTRSHSGMNLNPAGEIVYERVRRMLWFLSEIARRVDQAGRGRRGCATDRMISTGQLQAVIAVARARGFSAAATALGVSEPTIHRAAREFEKLLAAPLFLRRKHSVEMTRVGEDVARLANLALREIATAFEELDEANGVRAGKIVVGSLPLARTDILPEAIVRLCENEPGASVEIAEGPYDSLMHRLRMGDLDFLVGALRGPAAHEEASEVPLFDDSLSIIARTGHPLVRRRNIALAELAEYPWVVPRNATPTRRRFDRLFEGVDFKCGIIECSSLVVLRAILIKSDRLTLLSRRQILYEEQQGLLVALPDEVPFGQRPIGVTTRKNWKPSRLQRIFLKYLSEAAKPASMAA